jgi:hypothetical protein
MGRSECAQLPSDGWEAIDADPVCALGSVSGTRCPALGVNSVPAPRCQVPGTCDLAPVPNHPPALLPYRHFITPSLFFIAHRSVPKGRR